MSVITYYEDKTMIGKCSHGFKMITGNLNIGTYRDVGAAMDLSKLLPIKVHYVGLDGDGGFVGQYDYTNKTVLVFEAGTSGTHLHAVTTGDDLSAVDMRFVAIGK